MEEHSKTDNKEHISFTSTTRVNNICKELFDASGLDAFIVCYQYFNGSVGVLASRKDLVEDLTQSIYRSHHSDIDLIPYERCYLHKNLLELTTLPNSYKKRIKETLQIEKEQLNLDYKFTIRERHSDHIALYTFYAEPGKSKVLNFYLNNFNDLLIFIIYFKKEAKALIKLIKNKRIIKSKRATSSLVKQSHRQFKSILSSHDEEICMLLCQGLTAREIAYELRRSPRTIESYLYKLKARFKCRNTTQLVAKFVSVYGIVLNQTTHCRSKQAEDQ